MATNPIPLTLKCWSIGITNGDAEAFTNSCSMSSMNSYSCFLNSIPSLVANIHFPRPACLNNILTCSSSIHAPSAGLIIAIPRYILELANATKASPRVPSTAVISTIPTLAADKAFR